jgi:outer membrane protein
MNKSLLGASLIALALAAPAVHAHQAGDIIVRAGAATVSPNEDSGNLKLDGAKIGGTKATLDSDTQLGLALAYMVTDHIGIELLAATPFQHQVSVKGLGAGLDGKLADIKHLPPTLSAVYYPLDKNSAFQPYVGLGINYTIFFDEDLSSEAEAATFSNLELDDSWGLAYQLGMDYMLTENVMLNDTDGALTTMNALKELGVRLNMDDFGTGYSSLGYLRAYPFDGIKIDKRFIASISTGSNDRAVVQAIIGLGKAMGLNVTAEGVETEEQMELLRGFGCDQVQGYLISKPLPIEPLVEFLLRNAAVGAGLPAIDRG